MVFKSKDFRDFLLGGLPAAHMNSPPISMRIGSISVNRRDILQTSIKEPPVSVLKFKYHRPCQKQVAEIYSVERS